jgi:molybdenum cofactor cytidylyltransferase
MTAQNRRRVAAVVLAAGRSARMGQVKQLLPLGDGTVLEQTLASVRSAGVDEVVLVLGCEAEAIRRQLPAEALDRVQVVINPEYESGMASSLRAGLAAVGPEAEAALIVLGDQPFVRAGTIRQIIEQYWVSSSASGAEIVIPFYQRQRGNPVLLGRRLFPEAMALTGDTGCRAIFGRHPELIAQVEVDDPGILIDIDSREDYERLGGG